MLDTPRKVVRKPKSEEPKSAGNRYPPCNICYKEHGSLCPYWRYIPPGSTVGSRFSVICHICGHKLGMPDWVCYLCGGKRAGKVIKKWCSICDRMYEHESADCPYDKTKAAKYRWIREEEKKRKYKPLEPCDIPYVPRKPIPQEFW